MAIKIKKANRGKLHRELGVKAGSKISDKKLNAAAKKAKKSGNTAEEKRITFAKNAKKWKKK